MAILEIITPENPTLLQKGETVTMEQLRELQPLIDDMIETMHDANGAGLAAPQIGRSLRLAVVETLPKVDDDGIEIEDSRELHVIVNPEIVWTSRKLDTGIEGCLSIPGYVGEVERPYAIRVKTMDRHGKKRRLKLNGWTARIFQHEIDHLDGILYTDRLTAPENYWLEDVYYADEEEESAEEVVSAD
jgi:peptide deformylase